MERMAKIFYCVLILSLNWHLSVAQKCSTQSACSCSIDEYTTINLKGLQVPQGGFYYDGDLQNITYFFSGCENRKFDPSVYHLLANTTLETVSVSLEFLRGWNQFEAWKVSFMQLRTYNCVDSHIKLICYCSSTYYC